ncbi:MAG TPA: hypothetical protein PKA63_13135 [Oligoflexia bacterium]|nr:hypothetical protein [Oligoflexia bacterium]HMP49604.1 hypothetical protein [Oligoflexia bacterium]
MRSERRGFYNNHKFSITDVDPDFCNNPEPDQKSNRKSHSIWFKTLLQQLVVSESSSNTTENNDAKIDNIKKESQYCYQSSREFISELAWKISNEEV